MSDDRKPIPEATTRPRLINFIKTHQDKISPPTTDPAGSNTQIQFNDGGSFGASSNLVYDGTTFAVTSGVGNQLTLYENSTDNTSFDHRTGQFTISVDGGGDPLILDARYVQVGKATFGVESPKVAFEVHYSGSEGNLDPARSGNISSNEGGGEVIYFGAGTLTAGKIHYLASDGTWAETDADSKATGGDQLLGISLGTNPKEDGMLTRGFFNVHSSYLNGTFASGKPLYLSPDSGEFDIDRPTESGNFVRVIGYCTTLANVVYFNPSSTYVEI